MVADGGIPFLVAEEYSGVCMLHGPYSRVHPWMLGCLCTLAVVNNAAASMGGQASPPPPDFISSGSIPRSGTGGSQGGSSLMFSEAPVLCPIVAAPGYLLPEAPRLCHDTDGWLTT